MTATGFNNRQLKKLATPLDTNRVKTREQGGKTLSYIEGWFAIAEANRIFGYDGWDRELVHCERLFDRRSADSSSCAYAARVRLTVRAASTMVVREGTGFGQATAPTSGEAHERALKAAETDATKRALATFGGRFGLLLYDKDRLKGGDRPDRRAREPATATIIGVNAGSGEEASGASTPGPQRRAVPDDVAIAEPYPLVAVDGSLTELRSPEAFCTGLRQLIAAARDLDEIARLRIGNEPVLRQLRLLTNLTTLRGAHYTDVLERLIDKRVAELAAEGANELAREVPPITPSATVTEAVTEVGKSEEDPGMPVAVSMPAAMQHFVPVPPYPLAQMVQRLAPEPSTTPAQTSDHAAPPTQQEILLPTRRSQISGGYSIDKSVFALPSERRLRSKAHLVFVASRPCLVCEGQPCHAHHVTFAQPRGLSQKVSDEFTVPLCVEHHNALHASHNEASWWRSQGIEPLSHAQALWRQSAMDNAPLPETPAP